MLQVNVRFGTNQTSVTLQNCYEGSSKDVIARECVRVLTPAWPGIADAASNWTFEPNGTSYTFIFTPVGGTKA